MRKMIILSACVVLAGAPAAMAEDNDALLQASYQGAVTGDAEKGDLKLDTLRVALGPAELTGHGEVKGLLSEKPEVKGLELTGKNLDPEVLAQYYPPLRKKLNSSSSYKPRISGQQQK